MQNNSARPLPTIFISNEITQQRIQRFSENKRPILNNALVASGNQKEETKSIWYSKEHIETWLDEMNLQNADGMRIYFGEYCNEDGAYAGQLCLVMVTTRINTNNGSHEDIILENEPDFPDRLAVTERSRSIDDINDKPSSKRGYNYGAPCPPIC